MHGAIHILGVGSIGSLFAVHLRKANFRPILLSRQPVERDHLASITLECDGLPTVVQDFQQEYIRSSDSQPISFLLVCCKVQATVQLVKQLAHRLNSESIVVFLQSVPLILSKLRRAI